MMALTRIRPSSMAGDGLVRPARTPKVETDAGENHRDQNQGDRTPEEACSEEADRLLQGILGDLPEDDADDERRARPIVAFEQIAEASHHHDEDEVLPDAAIEIAT